MSLEIVELALARFTDWATFENLATEIMRDHGYPDIKPLGGFRDGGQDATAERFFAREGKRHKVVFQFTLRKDVVSKVRETIRRLEEQHIEYSKLVIVTTAPVSAETVQRMQAEVRRGCGVDLDVFERRTLVTSLADPANGLFVRFFPDIRRQAESYCGRAAAQSRGLAGVREREFLRICSTFAFDPAAQRTRRSLFDQAVLAILGVEASRPLTPTEVHERSATALGEGVFADVAQVRASLARLDKGGLVHERDGSFSIACKELVVIEGVEASMQAVRDSAINDIVHSVCDALGEDLSDEELTKLERNARDLFVEYFRTAGLEISDRLLGGSAASGLLPDRSAVLMQVAGRGLHAQSGRLLCDAVADALAHPTADQATYFANYSRAYLALAAMNLDPSLREFQATRFSSKTFVLDTDAVLEAIIGDCPNSVPYRKLVSALASMGADVLVPEAVLSEVVTHLKISPRTYRYFGASLRSMPQAMVEARVRNVLVRGFYYRCRQSGCTPEDFARYRADFVSPTHATAFVLQVVQEALPGVLVKSVEDYFGVKAEVDSCDPVYAVLHDLAREATLSGFRTPEQTEELAMHDVLLMRAVLARNAGEDSRSQSVLGSGAYIVTRSSRYMRTAAQCGTTVRVSARPQVLIALLEMVGPTRLSDAEFVALFDNPFVQWVGDACWEGVKVLLDAGVDLAGRSLPALRYDVDTKLSSAILRLREAALDDETGLFRSHVALAQEANAIGYRLTPVLEKVREVGALKERQISDLLEENAQLRGKLEEFGRKRRRWLRRFDKGKRADKSEPS